VLLLLSFVFQLFGVEQYLYREGVNLNIDSLLIFSALFGMGGSFISLALSKWLAKIGMGVKVVEQPANHEEAWLIQTVQRLARKADIGIPEVGIFESDAPNAFATGMSRNHALVAVSSGLLRSMSNNQVEAVLGHEITHVANGDMVTLGLIQGVVNTFVIFLARIIGFVVDRALFRNDRGVGIGYFATTIIAQVFLSILASMIVMAFSRWREFRADAGGASLAGRENMISALRSLQHSQQLKDLPGSLAAFGLSGGLDNGITRLFMSHPPLEERIAVLEHLDAPRLHVHHGL
jgi:heat shock protein HtpX